MTQKFKNVAKGGKTTANDNYNPDILHKCDTHALGLNAFR